MAGNRVLEPPRNLDPELRLRSQVADLSARLALLERNGAPVRRVFNVSAVSSVNLGAIDGDNITGVRINLHGLTATSGNVAFVLRPNGLTSIFASSLQQRAYHNGTGLANSTDMLSTEIVAGATGVYLASHDWGTTGNAVSIDGTFFTKGHVRQWLGIYCNRDAQVDGNRMLNARVMSEWNDTTTSITSLTLAVTAGTFTGRIAVEVVP